MKEDGTPYRILIADDHQLILDGIGSMLQTVNDYIVEATATDGRDALALVNADPYRFDLILTDVSMAQVSGIELCREIKTHFSHIKVVMLSMYSSAAVIKEALAAEADGYLLKNTGKEELVRALHRVLDGGTYFTQDILPIIYNLQSREKQQQTELDVLSVREKEVLSLIVKEHTSEEIAEKLFISKKTVDNHRQNILTKTNSRSTVGLVKFALRNGLVN